MYQNSLRYQFIVATILMVVMILTRFQHFGSAIHLPDASWAVFIAAGFFLARWSAFLIFMAAAALIDYLAISQFGVSSFCVSSAYGFLVPAYAVLWSGGRWLRNHYEFSARMLLRVGLGVLFSTALAFIISSGSFYWLSGRIGETSMAGFAGQIAAYYPGFLAVTAGYIAVIAPVYVVVEWMVAHRNTHASV